LLRRSLQLALSLRQQPWNIGLALKRAENPYEFSGHQNSAASFRVSLRSVLPWFDSDARTEAGGQMNLPVAASAFE
jgi:hypothetical protein